MISDYSRYIRIILTLYRCICEEKLFSLCLFMCSGGKGGNCQFIGLEGVREQIKDLWEMVATILNTECD